MWSLAVDDVHDGRASYRSSRRARGQEVHLIRGSEWQTGARLCPTGVPYCVTPGIRAGSPSCNGGEDKEAARLSTRPAPSRAMIANLISPRSLISPEAGRGCPSARCPKEACLLRLSFLCRGVAWWFTLFTCSFLRHPLEFI